MRRAEHLDRFLARRKEVAGMRPADEPQALDPLRVDRREDLSHPSAERLAGDDRLVDANRLEELEQILGVFLRRVVAVRPSTVAVAPLVERIHVEPRPEGAGGRFPHAPVARGRVQEHQVGLGTGPFVVVDRQTAGQGDGFLVEGARRVGHRLVPPAGHSTVRRVSPHAYTVPAHRHDARYRAQANRISWPKALALFEKPPG
jgi:hypothetical protein